MTAARTAAVSQSAAEAGYAAGKAEAEAAAPPPAAAPPAPPPEQPAGVPPPGYSYTVTVRNVYYIVSNFDFMIANYEARYVF